MSDECIGRGIGRAHKNKDPIEPIQSDSEPSAKRTAHLDWAHIMGNMRIQYVIPNVWFSVEKIHSNSE